MKSNWRKQMMISALALTLSAANATQYLQVRLQMVSQTQQKLHRQWEQRRSGIVGRKKWETLKNDWTQISLSPRSNATELNFAWYTPKQTNDNNSNADVEAKVQAISLRSER